MTLDLEALRRVFLDEAEELLDSIEEAVGDLGDAPDDRSRVWDLFRYLHTLKGDAGTVGFPALAGRAHRAEDLVETLHGRATPVDEPLHDLLFDLAADLRLTLHDELDGTPRPEDPALVARCQAALDDPDRGTREGTAPAGSPGTGREGRPGGIGRLAVSLASLDRLVERVSEVTVAHHRVARLLAAERPLAEVRDRHDEAERLLVDLQELALALRMVPVDRLFRRFQGTVHHAAAAEGKKARLVTEGDEVEIDARLAEALREPLLHMVRNAIGHGLEAPESRTAAGKDPTGTITLRARSRRDRVEISVGDDGAGVDVAALARRAGVALDEGVAAPVLDWMTRPGLSTREDAGEVAGRGVGMDVVRRQIDELRGSIELDTRPGEGTEIRLRLPSSVALVDALELVVADETYLLPIDAAERTVPLAGARPADADGMLALDGEMVPWLRLSRRFQAPLAERPADRETVVLVRHGGRRAGLVVDGLKGQSQHLIRPLAGPLADVHCIAGSSLLADGTVALILDVAALVASMGSGGDAPFASHAGLSADPRPKG
jgi:two-component system chemotaxis sensor kinase CheA